MASATQSYCVRIDRSGEGQSIRIPDEFALRGDEAKVTQDSLGRLIVVSAEPEKSPSLIELLHAWGPLGDEDAMPEIEDLAVEPFDL